MASQNSSLEIIEDFLAQMRIALIGVSRKPGSFSVPVFQEFCRRGYDVVPVNPCPRICTVAPTMPEL
jgi:predicted CoA-binding protein